jgi:benzoyl-CoA-dihydrodiol lyase
MSHTESPRVDGFSRHPDSYQHWRLAIDGAVATLTMDVNEKGSLGGQHELVLNSYDLGVDIELADAITRLRFEHPAVRALVIDSAKDRVFCAGANIRMLAASSHAFKVNFCKFTNETRCHIEDASETAGLKTLAALRGTASGGGYELALACDSILLVDDRSSAVSFPETPLLGVLPGTGGLTRLVDKRKIRRDRADFFSTTAEGLKGKRALDWGFVDALAPLSRWDETVREAASALAAASTGERPTTGIRLEPVDPELGDDAYAYRHLSVVLDRGERTATFTLTGPAGDGPRDAASIRAAGADWWPIRAFRELDDAILRLRVNEAEIGTWILRTSGDIDRVLAVDALLESLADDWLVGEARHLVRRTLKRLENSSRSLFALVEPGSAFAGSLLELALAADRIYMLDDEEGDVPWPCRR